MALAYEGERVGINENRFRRGPRSYVADLESQSISGVSQLHYDHGRFFGVAFPSIEHTHVDSSTTAGVYQSQCEVRPLYSHRYAGSIHFPATLRIPPYTRIGGADRQPLPAW